MYESAVKRKLAGEPVARGIAALVISQGVFILCGYLFYIYLARKLGPADYGLFGFVFTVLVWFEILTCGTRDALIKYINTYPRSFVIIHRPFTIVQTFISLVLAILVYLAFLPLAFYRTRYGALFFIAFLDLPLMGFYQLYVGYLNGFRLYTRQALASAVYSVAKAGFIILFVQLGYGVGGALFGNIFSTILAFAASYSFFLPKRREEIALGSVLAPPGYLTGAELAPGHIVRISFLFILIPLFYNLVMSMDLWLVNLVVGGETVGFYVAACTISKSIFFLFSAFYLTLFPVAIALLREEDQGNIRKLFSLSFTIFFFIAFPASLLLSVNAGGIALLVYGSAYQRAGSFISILAIAYFFLTLNVFFLYMLYAGGLQKEALNIILSTTLTGMALIYLLTEWRGAIGAAVGITITTFASSALSYFVIHHRLRLEWQGKRLAESMALALIVFLPLAFIPRNETNFIPLSLLFAVIYCLVLSYRGFLSSSDLKRWINTTIGGKA